MNIVDVVYNNREIDDRLEILGPDCDDCTHDNEVYCWKCFHMNNHTSRTNDTQCCTNCKNSLNAQNETCKKCDKANNWKPKTAQ